MDGYSYTSTSYFGKVHTVNKSWETQSHRYSHGNLQYLRFQHYFKLVNFHFLLWVFFQYKLSGLFVSERPLTGVFHL